MTEDEPKPGELLEGCTCQNCRMRGMELQLAEREEQLRQLAAQHTVLQQAGKMYTHTFVNAEGRASHLVDLFGGLGAPASARLPDPHATFVLKTTPLRDSDVLELHSDNSLTKGHSVRVRVDPKHWENWKRGKTYTLEAFMDGAPVVSGAGFMLVYLNRKTGWLHFRQELSRAPSPQHPSPPRRTHHEKTTK